MVVNGIHQIAMRSVDRNSSNGLSTYTAVEWADPSTGERRCSCNCPGWANRRYCKHTQELIDNPGVGLLDDERYELPVSSRPNSEKREGRVVDVETTDGRKLRGFTFE